MATGAIVSKPGMLSGLRVLDFTQVLSGPYATMLLADAGADVVKVEKPGTGDVTRRWGPPFVDGQSVYFLAFNRGKRSIALDLGRPDDRAVAHALADRADVLIENLRPGSLERFALDAASARRRNARLVYVSIRGYAANGPRAGDSALEVMLEAETGLMDITGSMGSESPTRLGVAAIDMMTGMNAVAAVFAALLQREKAGVGAEVTISLEESAAVMMTHPWWLWLLGGVTYPASGSAHPSIAPYEAFATSDRPVLFGAVTDEEFARVCATVGHPEWAQDVRWATNARRVQHRAALHEALEACFRTRPAAEWERQLRAARLPVAIVQRVSDAATAWSTADSPRVTAQIGPGVAWDWPTFHWLAASGQQSTPPRLNQDRDQVLNHWGIG